MVKNKKRVLCYTLSLGLYSGLGQAIENWSVQKQLNLPNWLVDEHFEMPVDLFVLLQAIVDNGSLRAAAEESKLSYRHAWGMLQLWQQRFSHPLVELKRGRSNGAVLTTV
jgi:hypothetical protein